METCLVYLSWPIGLKAWHWDSFQIQVCEVAAAPRHVVWEILGRLWWWVTDMKCTNEVAFWLR